VQVLIDGEWEDADAKVAPAYPDADAQVRFDSNYQSYRFELLDVTTCGGVRIIGMAGGSAHFTSISELSVEFE
jgi:hypothetical protein